MVIATDSQSKHRDPSPTKQRSSASKSSASADHYYGHERTAKLSAAFITSLFACPEAPPPSGQVDAHGRPIQPRLSSFIAYALHRTRLAASVTFSALFLLQRLKTRFPAARGSSGHRLFISAFMIASKVVCDDTYSNKSWAVVGQGMFALKEINQMEREMCGYLEWHLNVPGSELEVFVNKLEAEFGPTLRIHSSNQTKPVTIALESTPAAFKETPPPVPETPLRRLGELPTLSEEPEDVIAPSTGDDEEDIGSPSHSSSSSPESDDIRTPSPNAGADDHVKINSHHHVSGGVAPLQQSRASISKATGPAYCRVENKAHTSIDHMHVSVADGAAW